MIVEPLIAGGGRHAARRPGRATACCATSSRCSSSTRSRPDSDARDDVRVRADRAAPRHPVPGQEHHGRGARALLRARAARASTTLSSATTTAFVHFFHGHSYAGNPIACAAALASLDLFDEEGTLARATGIARRAAARLEELRAHPLVRDARQAGAMIGVELCGEAIDPQVRSRRRGASPTASTAQAISLGRSATCCSSFPRSARPTPKSTDSSMPSETC